jgi:hypothetical protein
MSSTPTIQQTEIESVVAPSPVRVPTDGGDHDLFSHYVTMLEWDAAYITGRPATALCGKKWVPTKDPERFPVCPDCKRIFDSLPPGDGDQP